MTAVLHGDLAAYESFLQGKADFHRSYGHTITTDEVNPILKPHQRHIVQWAVEGGRRAIFAAFGLGKTLMQLETIRLTLGGRGRGLIVLPLGVRQEFFHDAGMLGIQVRFIRRSDEVDEDGIYLTNYESVRDGRLDPNLFQAVSLDEASVLRSYGSKTYQEFLTLFDQVPYRFVATATPSPNRYKELIHYAGFLGVMDTGQALTRFFQRDSTKANHLTLYPHKEREFFLWLNTWAVFVQKPSDLGFPDDGYILPDLDVRWHEIPVDHMAAVEYDRDGQGHLIRGGVLGVTQASREKRDTMDARIAQSSSSRRPRTTSSCGTTSRTSAARSRGRYPTRWRCSARSTSTFGSSGSSTSPRAAPGCWPPNPNCPGPAATSSGTATGRSSSASASSSTTSSRPFTGCTGSSRPSRSASTSSTPSPSVRSSEYCGRSGRSTTS